MTSPLVVVQKLVVMAPLQVGVRMVQVLLLMTEVILKIGLSLLTRPLVVVQKLVVMAPLRVGVRMVRVGGLIRAES